MHVPLPGPAADRDVREGWQGHGTVTTGHDRPRQARCPSRRHDLGIGAGTADESAGTPGSVGRAPYGPRPAVIYLGLALPTASSGPPAGSGGQPSNACAVPGPHGPGTFRPCSGWGLPSRPGHPGRWCALTAPFHPYRHPRTPAVCFLWHCPAGHPGWVLPTTPPCGARTFLGGSTAAEPTRPPGRLIRDPEHMTPRPGPAWRDNHVLGYCVAETAQTDCRVAHETRDGDRP